MSTIKSSAENLTLNADGANNDIKFQSNGSEVAQIDQAGVISSTGGTTHADNVKAKFGAGNDLEIYHDGSHSYIADVGTGDLTIRASNDLRLQAASTEAYLTCNENAGVEIYHNNVKKIETTANGAYVTGELEVTQAANNEAVDVSTNATTTNAIRVIASELTTGRAGYFYSNASGTQTRQIVRIDNDHANATGTTSLYVGNDSTGLAADFHGDIRSRDGIRFGTDTAAANTLDDYEQGTWTPAIAGTTGSFNISGTSNYTKIGNLVTVNSYIYNGTNIGNTAAEWDFTGLPYTPIRDAICAVRFHNVNIPSDVKYCVVAIQTGSSGIEVWGVRDAASMDILQWSDIGSGHVEFTCTYSSTS